MKTCARCGLPETEDAFPSALIARTHCRVSITAGTGLGDEAVIDCRDRELANLRSLLRSVTGKLEEAAELCHYNSTAGRVEALINQVLEVLS